MGKQIVVLGIAALLGIGLTGCSPSVQSECDSVNAEVKNMDSDWNNMNNMDDVLRVSESYRTIALKLASMNFSNQDLQAAIDDFSKSTLALATGMATESTSESQANTQRNEHDLAWAGLARVCNWTY